MVEEMLSFVLINVKIVACVQLPFRILGSIILFRNEYLHSASTHQSNVSVNKCNAQFQNKLF